MLQVVVIFNVLISLLCLYVAWQVWNLRRVLAVTTAALKDAERNTYAVLHGAPQAVTQGQLGVHGLRERYQHLELQLQKVQQALALLTLIQSIWPVVLMRRAVPDRSTTSREGSPLKRLRLLKRQRRRR